MPKEKKEAEETEKRPSQNWLSEKVLKHFNELGMDELLEEALSLIKSKRVLDFNLSSGSFNARVYGNTGAPKLVTASLPVILEENWSKIFELMSQKSLFSACILANNLPIEIEDVFDEVGEELFLSSAKKLKIEIEGSEIDKLCPLSAALLYKFYDQLIENPFLMLVLRGRGRDESIIALREHRIKQNKNLVKKDTAETAANEDEPEETRSNLLKFWTSLNQEQLEEICYNIKADELPAAILKRLDPLPLSGLEDEVDVKLERAYEHITNRAQAYGLGL